MSDHEEKILSAAKGWEVPESRSKEEIWDALEKQIQESDDSKNFSRVSFKWLVAASIVLMAFGLVFLLFFQSTTVETGIAEVRSVELPDGSRVVLNANSRLGYVASSFERNRQLDFSGEAYFEIEPGAAFTVYLDGVEVTVLGTTFNIYARNETKEVKCMTGKVQVSDTNSSVILESGLSISTSKGKLEEVASNFEISNAISWQEGKFLFTNAPLSRVVKELEIQYGVTVQADGLEGRYYSGYFDNTNLEKAVKKVFSPMGYSYEISDKKILIK
ncbi:MAG: FecR domain-containing protein [Reichenbachiella sp.]|uniref:FecR family protein n=1 Tax=Reichenbachiella sp. TaxID=2184521 RepID=UPI003265410F